MKTAILHIGQSKTGSTSIQALMDKNRDPLRAQGVYYHAPAVLRICQHYLNPLIVEREEIPQNILNGMGFDRDLCIRRCEEEWLRTVDQAASPDLSTILFSTESMFCVLTPAHAERLRRLMHQVADDFRVLAYLRSPASHYLSSVQQNMKFRSVIRPHTVNHLLPTIESYRQAFGDRLECRVFERAQLLSGDVTVDFADWAGLRGGLDLSKAEEHNVSLSAEAMSVFNRINPVLRATAPDGRREQDRRIRAVAVADAALPGATRPRLRPEIVDHLTRINTDLPILRDRYGLSFSDVDYALVGQTAAPMPAEFGSVEQICDFDPARRDALEAMVRKRLAPPPKWRRVLRRLAML